MRHIIIVALSILLLKTLSGCQDSTDGILDNKLEMIVDSFIVSHPSSNIYTIQFFHYGDKDVICICTSPCYSKDFTDCYFIKDSRLITCSFFYKKDWSYIINRDKAVTFKDTIPGYNDDSVFGYSELELQSYMVDETGNIISDVKYDELNLVKAEQNEILQNNSLNMYLNKYINEHSAMIYQLKIDNYHGCEYVSINGNCFFDSKQANGFFYRNGHPVVVYFLSKSKERLMDRKMLRNAKELSEYYKDAHIELWNVPPPQRYKIISADSCYLTNIDFF